MSTLPTLRPGDWVEWKPRRGADLYGCDAYAGAVGVVYRATDRKVVIRTVDLMFLTLPPTQVVWLPSRRQIREHCAVLRRSRLAALAGSVVHDRERRGAPLHYDESKHRRMLKPPGRI